MEDLKQIKKCLVAQVMGQMGNLQECDAKELGEVVDMIKDMEEAMYYCTIVKAMEEGKEEEPKWYTEPIRYSNSEPRYYTNPRYYTEDWRQPMWRDEREGRSPMQRKMYMEATNQTDKMKELEKYIRELTEDLMDMIKDASPEEREMLQRKISTLATKINV